MSSAGKEDRANLQLLLGDQEFDAPFYKVLARNDTPSAPGHQGGVVIPKDLRVFFPPLDAQLANPTVDVKLDLQLSLAGENLGRTQSRYQLQTWRGRRKPESRLTAHLGRLLRHASPGDILIFQRRRGTEREYRLTLIPKGSDLAKLFPSRRWGTLSAPPMRFEELQDEIKRVASKGGTSPFLPEDERRPTSQVKRIQRTDAFRLYVRQAYRYSCSVCGVGLRTDSGSFEVEAAHIVPVGVGGADVVANGICMCRTHHWAFDAGIFSISDDYRIVVTDRAKQILGNEAVLKFEGKKIKLPSSALEYPSREALQWHRTNVALL